MVAVAVVEWEQPQEALLEQAVLQGLGVLEVLMQRMVGLELRHQVEAVGQEVLQQLQVRAVLDA
jgi:FixJ family two-component response regulator